MPCSFERSRCSVACTLDLVGDKWSLLVIRDLFRGKSTYGELQSSFEGIPTNILADRLKKLEDVGLISKSAYQQHPIRYAYGLTVKGRGLGDVLLAIVRWGTKYIPGTEAVVSSTAGPVGADKLLNDTAKAHKRFAAPVNPDPRHG